MRTSLGFSRKRCIIHCSVQPRAQGCGTAASSEAIAAINHDDTRACLVDNMALQIQDQGFLADWHQKLKLILNSFVPQHIEDPPASCIKFRIFGESNFGTKQLWKTEHFILTGPDYDEGDQIIMNNGSYWMSSCGKVMPLVATHSSHRTENKELQRKSDQLTSDIWNQSDWTEDIF